MINMEKEILKVLVGSQAHGLANENSDFDYRGVFLVPTDEILKIGGTTKQTNWIEGKEDNTSWELSHFLLMAVKSNPTILESFLAPVLEATEEGNELRDLFPHVWSSKGVMDAFIGYGLNQRKKMLEDKDGKANKFAAAYLRTLYNAYELLSTGTFTIRIADTPIGTEVLRYKNGEFTNGEVIDLCTLWEKNVRAAYENNPDKETNLEPINEFILKVRRAN